MTLTSTEEASLLAVLRIVADAEVNAEELRCRLCEVRDFDPSVTFKSLQSGWNRDAGFVSAMDLKAWITNRVPHYMHGVTLQDAARVIMPFANEHGELRFEDFQQMMLPKDPTHAFLTELAFSRESRVMGCGAASLDITVTEIVAHRLCQILKNEITMHEELKLHQSRLSESGVCLKDIVDYLNSPYTGLRNREGLISLVGLERKLVYTLCELSALQCEALLRRINPCGDAIAVAANVLNIYVSPPPSLSSPRWEARVALRRSPPPPSALKEPIQNEGHPSSDKASSLSIIGSQFKVLPPGQNVSKPDIPLQDISTNSELLSPVPYRHESPDASFGLQSVLHYVDQNSLEKTALPGGYSNRSLSGSTRSPSCDQTTVRALSFDSTPSKVASLPVTVEPKNFIHAPRNCNVCDSIGLSRAYANSSQNGSTRSGSCGQSFTRATWSPRSASIDSTPINLSGIACNSLPTNESTSNTQRRDESFRGRSMRQRSDSPNLHLNPPCLNKPPQLSPRSQQRSPTLREETLLANDVLSSWSRRRSPSPVGARSLSPSMQALSSPQSSWATHWADARSTAIRRLGKEVLRTMLSQADADARLDDLKARLASRCTLEEVFGILDRHEKGWVSDVDLWQFADDFGTREPFTSFAALVNDVHLHNQFGNPAVPGRISFLQASNLILPYTSHERQAIQTANTETEARSILYLLRYSEPCPDCGIRVQRSAECSHCPHVTCPVCFRSFQCFCVVSDQWANSVQRGRKSVPDQFQIFCLLDAAARTAIELENCRTQLSLQPGFQLPALRDVFDQIAHNQATFDKNDLKQAFAAHGLALQIRKLDLLWNRYASHGGLLVNFPNFTRQLMPHRSDSADTY